MRELLDIFLWCLFIWGLFMDWAFTLKIFACYVAVAVVLALMNCFCLAVTRWNGGKW